MRVHLCIISCVDGVPTKSKLGELGLQKAAEETGV